MSEIDVLIVGAGFTGLTAGYKLSKAGKKVHVIEADSCPGGLAGTFEFQDGVTVEKFYHHWFNNDVFVTSLIEELGLENDIILSATRTGMYFNGRLWRLSTPLDLLLFRALSFFDRIRLGLLILQIRRIKDWKQIEHLTIREWLEPLCGKSVYKVVWEPLISAKFSIFAETVNAVWMWKKLVLRGGTRNGKGAEELAYFRGGFGRLAEKLAEAIRENGGEVSLNTRVIRLESSGKLIRKVVTDNFSIAAKKFLFTTPLPITADLFDGHVDTKWISSLRKIKYLGNMCLILRLRKSLSETYWLNVNDPGFPFVGVIEHTNFDSPENYKGSHIVYLSRYLPTEDLVWQYSDEEYFVFAIEHLKRMFPDFEKSWVIDYNVWRAEHAQPITGRNYSDYIPKRATPMVNSYIATMAQIYPEDRGTNYAIRDGMLAAEELH